MQYTLQCFLLITNLVSHSEIKQCQCKEIQDSCVHIRYPEGPPARIRFCSSSFWFNVTESRLDSNELKWLMNVDFVIENQSEENQD